MCRMGKPLFFSDLGGQGHRAYIYQNIYQYGIIWGEHEVRVHPPWDSNMKNHIYVLLCRFSNSSMYIGFKDTVQTPGVLHM